MCRWRSGDAFALYSMDLGSFLGGYPEARFQEELMEEKLLPTSWATSLVGKLLLLLY